MLPTGATVQYTFCAPTYLAISWLYCSPYLTSASARRRPHTQAFCKEWRKHCLRVCRLWKTSRSGFGSMIGNTSQSLIGGSTTSSSQICQSLSQAALELLLKSTGHVVCQAAPSRIASPLWNASKYDLACPSISQGHLSLSMQEERQRSSSTPPLRDQRIAVHV